MYHEQIKKLLIKNIMLHDNLKALIQYILPKHALTRLAGYLANIKIPAIKNYLIRYFINKYDDKIHRMFDNKMEINDNLYNEIDMKKAFFNFNKCDEYSGLPSGSFICVNGSGFTVDLFNKLVSGITRVNPLDRLDSEQAYSIVQEILKINYYTPEERTLSIPHKFPFEKNQDTGNTKLFISMFGKTRKLKEVLSDLKYLNDLRF